MKTPIRHLLDVLMTWLPGPKPVLDWNRTFVGQWRILAGQGYLQPIDIQSDIVREDLKGIDRQKNIADKNIQQFIKGFPANHMLLTGAKGCGKSSLIRALLNAYQDQGLRLIQVDVQHLHQLPQIVQAITYQEKIANNTSQQAFSFLLFCDDMSFNEDSLDYRVLKSILDGSSFTLPSNILLCGTSNRRHLVPENRTDNRQGAELHPQERIDEKISLSDRFGIWLSFYSLSQVEYLNICHHWVIRLAAQTISDYGNNSHPDLWNEKTRQAALKWALQRGHRSGRAAYQFARDRVGQYLLTI